MRSVAETEISSRSPLEEMCKGGASIKLVVAIIASRKTLLASSFQIPRVSRVPALLILDGIYKSIRACKEKVQFSP